MPNTIAHFAMNGLFTRAVISNTDFKWIYLSCVIPDLPWILQRIIRLFPVSIDLYDLRAYRIAQPSLLICIFLCMSFALLAKQRNKVFIILIISCSLHLLLDAVQIKWTNGVQLFAPINWSLLRFDFFWPESLGSYLLTGAGLLYLVINIRMSIQPNCNEFMSSMKFLSLSGVMLLAWLVLPIAYIPSVYAANNHYIDTLKNVQHSVGKKIEIDRNVFVQSNDGYKIKTAFGEFIALDNIQAENGALISLQGKLIDNHTIRVDMYHTHTRLRNYASMLNLTFVLLIWLIFISRSWINGSRADKE